MIRREINLERKTDTDKKKNRDVMRY